ncbi:hypothetical protein GCM10022381_09560 [Leifsonia kafniensis]|uniref:Uncharacterized protein n=2 Tax=Leifsonia kafniensis TaxID=475957 RepID=A0ABP7K773_9MICO
MGMADEKKSRANGAYAHLFEWVEDKLRPAFETPPPPGRYDAETTLDLAGCPLCGRSMREHVIDHSVQNTRLICPVPQTNAGDADVFEPVNEFGMVIHPAPEDSAS